jgi:hypothetical protein
VLNLHDTRYNIYIQYTDQNFVTLTAISVRYIRRRTAEMDCADGDVREPFSAAMTIRSVLPAAGVLIRQ